jgi:sigma-B regulation protein RsbU (phosphoserine phosphatase)
VTVFLVILDVRSGRLLFSNAGHNVPYLIDRAGTLALLEGGRGKPLGISAKYSFTTAERTLAPGDCLFLFTDGITEAMDAGQELFENHRLEECLRETAGRRCAQMVEEVVRRVHSFAGTTAQSDDITAMALRWLPAACDPGGCEHVVVIASRVADLPIITRQIDELAAANGWSGNVLADLQVVADEVLVNIMEYAYPVDEPGEIRISFGVSGHAIEMQFEDWGRHFDPLSVIEANRTAPLKDREPGGVGIHFVRSLMSEVSYSRVDDKNRLLVRRRLQTGEKSVGSV